MCEAIQHSDQMHCGNCNLTWDMNDPDPPQCLTPTQQAEVHMKPQQAEQTGPAHYQNYYTRPLTHSEKEMGKVAIKFDPYRICDVLNIGGGAREQILKKAIRWTTKGADERQVIKEIMQACERRLEMIAEDSSPVPAAPAPPPVKVDLQR